MSSQYDKKFSLDEMTDMHAPNVEKTQNEIPMVGLTEEEWNSLIATLNQMQTLTDKLETQNRKFFSKTETAMREMERSVSGQNCTPKFAYQEFMTNKAVWNKEKGLCFRHYVQSFHPDEMAEALMRELSRGVTGIPAVGMYTKEQRTMLLCVVNRRQVPTVRRIANEVDPDSFVVMAKAAQVLGLGFYSSEL